MNKQNHIFFAISNVFFDDEPMVCIVPSTWIQNISKDLSLCYWPAKSSQVSRLTKINAIPENDWLEYPFEILKKYDTNEKAQSQLPKFEGNDFNLESSAAEDHGRGKRKKTKSWKLFKDTSNSDSNDDCSPPLFSMPNGPSWAKTLKAAIIEQLIAKESLNLEPTSYATKKLPLQNKNSDNINVDCETQYQSQSLNAASNTSNFSSHDSNTVVNLLRQQIEAQNFTSKLLKKLLLKQEQIKLQSTIREQFSDTFVLPVDTVLQMNIIEENLQLPASRYLMFNRLSQCGGTSENETTSLILKTILTDECATHYNYEGHLSNKHAFKELTILNIIIDFTLAKHPTGSEYAVKTKIKNWLRLANTRIGNRKGNITIPYLKFNIIIFLPITNNILT